MDLFDAEFPTGRQVLWGGVFAAVYLLLYVVAPSSPVRTGSRLHGDLHFLLGMRAFNVLLFALTAVLTYVLADDVFGDERIGFLAALLVVVSPLANHAIVAWTHVPVAFLTLVAFLSYRRFLDGYETRWFVVLAAAASFIFTIKYPDVVLMLPILAHMAVLVVRDREYEIVRKSVVPLAVLLAIIAPTAAFHYSSFGSVTTTPYHMRPQALPPNDKPNIAVTFDPARLLQTVPAMLFRFDPGMEMLQQDVEDFDYAAFKSALFQSSPPLVLGLFGMLMAWRRNDEQRFTLLAASAAALITLLYGSWIYFSGGWTTNMRYLTPAIPFLAIFTGYTVMRMDVDWQRLRWVGGAAGAVAFFGLASYVMPMGQLAAKDVMNTVAFITVLVLLLVFLLADRHREERIYTAFYGVFGASIGVAGVMVFVLDNIKLFNAPGGTVLFANADKSIFLGAALAATLTAVLYGVVRKRDSVHDALSAAVNRLPDGR